VEYFDRKWNTIASAVNDAVAKVRQGMKRFFISFIYVINIERHVSAAVKAIGQSGPI